MSDRILIIKSIMLRPVIGLISVSLPFNERAGRKEFSYTPLALIFRRARALTNVSTHSTIYVDREGFNIEIAPRFEFMIHLASSLGSHSDHYRLITQQNRNETDETLSAPYQLITKNHHNLAKVTDQQRRSEVDRTLLISSNSVRQYPFLKGSNVYRYLKQTLGNYFLSSIPLIDYLNPMKVEDQSVWGERNFRLSLWSFVSRNYQTLAIPENKALRKVITSNFNAKENGEVHTSRQLINSSVPSELSIFHDRSKIAIIPVSEFLDSGHLLSEKIGYVWNLQRRNRTFGIKTSVFYQALTLNYQFMQRVKSMVRHSLKTSYSKRNNGKLNNAYTREVSHSNGLLTSNTSVSNYRKKLSGKDMWDTLISGRQIFHQRKSGTDRERLVSPVPKSYRTEKNPRPSFAAPLIEPTPIPINPPKIDIDRLSRDVWNKIEKRIRIERERHGRL